MDVTEQAKFESIRQSNVRVYVEGTGNDSSVNKFNPNELINTALSFDVAKEINDETGTPEDLQNQNKQQQNKNFKKGKK